MEPAVVLWSELSLPLSKMAPSQSLFFQDGQILATHQPVKSTVSTAPLHCCISDAADSHHVSTGLNYSSLTASSNQGKSNTHTSFFFVEVSFLFPLASIITSDPSWAQGTHFPPSSLPRAVIFQCLEAESQRGSFFAANHSTIFPEVQMTNTLKVSVCHSSISIGECPVKGFFQAQVNEGLLEQMHLKSGAFCNAMGN